MFCSDLDGDTCNDDVHLIEPDTESEELAKKGVLVARILTRKKQNIAYVRMLNLKDFDTKIKKGHQIGHAQTVTTISKCEEGRNEANESSSDELPVSLAQLKENSRPLLSDQEVEVFEDLIRKHKNVFSLTYDDMSRTNIVRLKINTGNNIPISQRPLAKQ